MDEVDFPLSDPPGPTFLEDLLADLGRGGRPAEAALRERDSLICGLARRAGSDPRSGPWALALVISEVLVDRSGYGRLDERRVSRWLDIAAHHSADDHWQGFVRWARSLTETVVEVSARSEPEAAPEIADDLARHAEHLGRLALRVAHGPLHPGEATGLAAVRDAYRALGEYDEAGAGEAIERLVEAIRTVPDDESGSLTLRLSLGMLYCARIERFQTFGDADLAVATLEPLRAWVDPTHATWSEVMIWLGRAYRARDDASRGDRALGREAGLASLRGYAWRALVATSTAGASVAGRGVVPEVDEVVMWCMADRQPAEVVRALEASRGLLVYTAARTGTVPEQLRAAGATNLAREWDIRRGDGPGGSAYLRRRVMRALLAGPGSVHAHLRDPLSCEDIQAALRTAGVDALAYLVPPQAARTPFVVVVPAAGAPAVLRLPPVAARMTALEAHLAGAPSGPALRELCEWAWFAAMDRVMTRLRRWAPIGRRYRLVLVPIGDFGLVPWHAARSPHGRYALQDVTVSYAASARLFDDGVARPPRPAGGDVLVVGDPTGDRPHAGEEARAIRRSIYPGAAYLGTRPGHPPSGTPEEILDWLRGALAADRAVLHLAVPAVVDAESSYLVLRPSATGSRLAAERMAEPARANGYRIGTVVLAAGASGPAYDEAYSLATMFLTHGAGSVVGSLWPVPEESTSLVMYLFHHHLAGGQPAAEALRRAQLWMLRPDRDIPATMPVRLRSRVPAIDADDLAAWAGFTHSGH